jgi:pimeloyl-ACP methyl ester carboxylesterase
MPRIRVDNAELFYSVIGEGTPVVLLHGAGGNGAVWYRQVPFLAARHKIIVMDHRGFGRSVCRPDDVDVLYFPDDLKAVLDAEGIERAALVCQSMGGWTGLGFSLQAPNRVAGIVLSATPGGLMIPAVRTHFERAIERAKTEPAADLVLTKEFQSAHADEAWLYGQINSFNTEGTNILGQLADPQRSLNRNRFVDWSIPTLILAGANDPIFPADGLKRIQGILSGSRLEIIPGASHSPYLENYHFFNRLAIDFLSSLSY